MFLVTMFYEECRARMWCASVEAARRWADNALREGWQSVEITNEYGERQENGR